MRPARGRDSGAAPARSSALNPRLADELTEADLIIYAPGTQHSSLFPSYLTPGLSDADRARTSQPSSCSSPTSRPTPRSPAAAPSISSIARCYYLNDKGRRATPTPCLITHYLRERPGPRRAGGARTCRSVKLKRSKIRGWSASPTTRRASAAATTRARCSSRSSRSLVERREPQQRRGAAARRRLANKVAQTLLEMVRGGIGRLPVDVDRVLRRRAARSRLRWTRCRLRSARSPRRDDAFRQTPCAALTSTTCCCSSRRACIAARTSRCWLAHSPSAASTRSGAAAVSRCATSRNRSASGTRHNAAPRRDQLRRQPRAQPGVSLLCTDATSRTRCRRCASVRAEDALRLSVPLTPQACQRAPAGAGSCDERPKCCEIPVQFFPHFAGTGETHQRRRRTAVAGNVQSPDG